MLKFALIHFTHPSAVEILAWEETEVVREAAVRPAVAVVGEGELAQLFLLWVALLLAVLQFHARRDLVMAILCPST